VGTGDPMGDPYPRGYEYGDKSIPTSVYGWPDGVIFCHGYGYGVVIPGGYLPIAISIQDGAKRSQGAAKQDQDKGEALMLQMW
jgi:hypothetical protein